MKNENNINQLYFREMYKLNEIEKKDNTFNN